MKLKVLSIDAWRESEGGWPWNNWSHAFDITKEEFERIEKSPRKVLKWMRDVGLLGDRSKGKLAVEDDQNNLVIVHRHTSGPLYAIEYGPAYDGSAAHVE